MSDGMPSDVPSVQRTLLKNLTHDLADITAHQTLNSVPAASVLEHRTMTHCVMHQSSSTRTVSI